MSHMLILTLALAAALTALAVTYPAVGIPAALVVGFALRRSLTHPPKK